MTTFNNTAQPRSAQDIEQNRKATLLKIFIYLSLIINIAAIFSYYIGIPTIEAVAINWILLAIFVSILIVFRKSYTAAMFIFSLTMLFMPLMMLFVTQNPNDPILLTWFLTIIMTGFMLDGRYAMGVAIIASTVIGIIAILFGFSLYIFLVFAVSFILSAMFIIAQSRAEKIALSQSYEAQNQLKDVTLELKRERKELDASNESLLIANRKLQDMDRLKDRFMASMSHELRTPLNAIIGFASMMREDGIEAIKDRSDLSEAVVAAWAKQSTITKLSDSKDKIELKELWLDVTQKTIHILTFDPFDSEMQIELIELFETTTTVADNDLNMFLGDTNNKELAEKATKSRQVALDSVALPLRIRPVTDDQMVDLSAIERSGTDLMGLIENVLNAAKIDAGLMVLNPISFRPIDIVEPTSSLVKGLSMSRFGDVAEFDMDIGEGLTEKISADRGKLQQIIGNLLSNAFKFTPPAPEGKVTFGLHRIDENLEISVTDNGVGIGEDDLNKLFARFQQVGEKNKGGTGLGLSICKDFAHLHNGEITATSEPGVGTVFTVTIPIEETVQNAELDVDEVDNDVEKPNLVIIDDNPNFSQIVGRILGDQYEITAITDSREALDRVAKIKDPTVIVDIHMPFMDGWSVITALREFPPTTNVPIIICTATNAMNGGGAEEAALMNVSYLAKPVTKESLLNELPKRIEIPKIIIIDDDLTTINLLRRALSSEEYDIRVAKDGEVGMRMIEEFRPDCITLDISMPRKNGFDVLHFLRGHEDKYFQSLPVIVYTADASLSHEDQKVELRRLAELVITKNGQSANAVVQEIQVILEEGATHDSKA